MQEDLKIRYSSPSGSSLSCQCGVSTLSGIGSRRGRNQGFGAEGGITKGVKDMKSQFVGSGTIGREKLDWGTRAWHTGYGADRADALVVIEVDLEPGFGHAFHMHARQEELVFVVSGEVEQWIGREKRILQAGDSAFLEAGTVHASYNVSGRSAKVLAILGPVIGVDGYEVEEVAHLASWSTLRNPGD